MLTASQKMSVLYHTWLNAQSGLLGGLWADGEAANISLKDLEDFDGCWSLLQEETDNNKGRQRIHYKMLIPHIVY